MHLVEIRYEIRHNSPTYEGTMSLCETEIPMIDMIWYDLIHLISLDSVMCVNITSHWCLLCEGQDRGNHFEVSFGGILSHPFVTTCHYVSLCFSLRYLTLCILDPPYLCMNLVASAWLPRPCRSHDGTRRVEHVEHFWNWMSWRDEHRFLAPFSSEKVEWW